MASDDQIEQPKAPAVRRALDIKRHLVIVHQPKWQALGDWIEIARTIRSVDPGTAVFVANSDRENVELRDQAATLPSLVFSAGPLGSFVPARGKVYHGRPIHKFEQLRRLDEAGVRVPPTTMLRPDTRLDRALWGEFVVVKPTDIASSSHGTGIQLMRTERVRYIRPEDYPEGHPGRKGPMVVQKYIDTGPRIAVYRVLTLFGEPLYFQHVESTHHRVGLDSADEQIEAEVIATQGVPQEARRKTFVFRADIAALVRAAYRAIPEVPLQGCDVVCDASTGLPYILELNPGGNTWHFSSSFQDAARAIEGPEIQLQRRWHLDAFGTAAHVLADVARREAV